MKTFMDELAAEVLRGDKTDFSELCIVLPNRRAGVFLKDALSKASNRAIWAPKILSIEDFVFDLSGSVKIDKTTLLFAFYEVYKKHVKDPQALELFANWAPTFLADINEVDINLVDAQDIFNQLYSIERISKWNPSGKTITEFQQKHIDFVKTFYDLYSAVRTNLNQQNKAYQGMAFRKVAENAVSYVSDCSWQQVWFAGFNALTVSEEEIMQVFVREERGRVFWDMDEFYTKDPIHEAGFYVRKYLNAHGRFKLNEPFEWNNKHFTAEPKEIHVISAQRNVAQAEAAASILNEKCNKSGKSILENIAVVLNDEKLLLPLLNSMPTQLNGVNITMGYGLQYSQSVSFVEKLFRLQMGKNSEGAFYHKDVLSVLGDGLYLSVQKRNVGAVRQMLIKEQKAYIKLEDFEATDLDKVLFGTKANSVADFLDYLKKVCVSLRTSWADKSNILESKFLSLIERMVYRLSDLHHQFGGIETLKTLQVFWRQLVNQQNLDFVGEPLGGLQIMGMLETRNLDFEEVIILGVNEGKLPSNAHSPSNFTFDIRRVFGLACQNERDAVTAYHFYRLIQRAKKVYLIYDQDTSSFGGGEVSRYVQQLEMEAPSNISIKRWGIKQTLPKSQAKNEITIPKGESEHQKLVSLAERGLSPSALNTFRSCSLKFYFKYVAGFKEDAELQEEVDHATFGTAVHDTLEELYKPIIGRAITEADLGAMQKSKDAVLESQFLKQVSIEKLKHGKNFLAFEVARTYVNRVIEHDLGKIKKGVAVTPLRLEEKLENSLSISVGDDQVLVKIKGLADRVDRLSDGVVRIIDYKTGSFDKDSDVRGMEHIKGAKADHAFQLLLYSFMFQTQVDSKTELQPTVFYLRAKNVEKAIRVVIDKIPISSAERIVFIKEYLMELLSGMLNKELAFVQTTDSKSCDYCDFKEVCQR